jgi:hypothetical protein
MGRKLFRKDLLTPGVDLEKTIVISVSKGIVKAISWGENDEENGSTRLSSLGYVISVKPDSKPEDYAENFSACTFKGSADEDDVSDLAKTKGITDRIMLWIGMTNGNTYDGPYTKREYVDTVLNGANGAFACTEEEAIPFAESLPDGTYVLLIVDDGDVWIVRDGKLKFFHADRKPADVDTNRPNPGIGEIAIAKDSFEAKVDAAIDDHHHSLGKKDTITECVALIDAFWFEPSDNV